MLYTIPFTANQSIPNMGFTCFLFLSLSLSLSIFLSFSLSLSLSISPLSLYFSLSPTRNSHPLLLDRLKALPSLHLVCEAFHVGEPLQSKCFLQFFLGKVTHRKVIWRIRRVSDA